MRVKMLKEVKDQCFGTKYKTCPQCENCWIDTACLICFRNKK